MQRSLIYALMDDEELTRQQALVEHYGVMARESGMDSGPYVRTLEEIAGEWAARARDRA